MTRPRGGHVLWVQLPDGVDSLELYEAAGHHGIRVAPGPLFSASLGYRSFVRLNTGFPWSPATERKIETLGRLVTDRVGGRR
jgi:DNA-binding transcriptional MocR family regulator